MGHSNQALTRHELSLYWVHAAIQAPKSTGLPETHMAPCSNWYSFSHLDSLSLCTHSPFPEAPDTLPCLVIHYKFLMFNLDYSKHNLSLPIAKPPCLSVWMSTRGDVHTHTPSGEVLNCTAGLNWQRGNQLTAGVHHPCLLRVRLAVPRFFPTGFHRLGLNPFQ